MENGYTRLPGRGTRFDGVQYLAGRTKSCRLFMGKDHLLGVESSWCVEEYRRFYFRDIQAIVIHRTTRRRNLNLIWGTVAGFAALFCCVSSDTVRVVWGCIALAVGIGVAINSMLGPRCVVSVKTAVQTDRLPSLGRLSNAQKALALLKPVIAAAQADLTAAQATVAPAEPPAEPVAYAVKPAIVQQVEVKKYNSNAHLLLFLGLIVDGLGSLAQIFFNSVPLCLMGSVVSLIVAGLLVFSVLRQLQTDLRAAVQRTTWCVVAYMVITFTVGQITGVMLASDVSRRGGPATELDMLRAMGGKNPFETPWLMAVLIFGAIGSLGLGTLGLWFLQSAKRSAQTPVGAGAPPPILPHIPPRLPQEPSPLAPSAQPRASDPACDPK